MLCLQAQQSSSLMQKSQKRVQRERGGKKPPAVAAVSHTWVVLQANCRQFEMERSLGMDPLEGAIHEPTAPQHTYLSCSLTHIG